MPDQDFDLGSGAKLHVTVADFQDAKALTKAIIKSTAGVKLADDIMSMDVTVLKDVLVNAATSDEVDRLLMRCMERATYDGTKITPALFDDTKIGEALRGDYVSICGHIIAVNCQPFFVQALSTLKTYLAKKQNSPK